MSYYPIFLDIEGKRCVVIGGGDVGWRKVVMLLDHGAMVEVISPQLCPKLDELAADERISAVRREYQPGDLEGAFLVVAATDDIDVNARIADEAAKRGVLINVVDVPRLSNFIVPSILRRGDLTIAVSTNGKSPALARKIRSGLEPHIGEEYAMLTSLVNQVRSELMARGDSPAAQRWQQALDLDILLELLRSGEFAKAREWLLRRLEAE